MMMNLAKRKNIDLLVEHFWKHGYMTVSRRFGTYLPEPEKVGGFDVDIIARHKENYAIGVSLTEEDFNNPKLLEKINYLATRQTKFTNKKVFLFLGVPEAYYQNAKALLELLNPEIKKNIRLFRLVDRAFPPKGNVHQNIGNNLFS
jgi:hypothetical protein